MKDNEHKVHNVMKKCQLYFLLFLLTAVSCTQKNENAGPRYSTAPNDGVKPVYIVAVHPLYNPKKLMQVYQPLIDYLNTSIKDAGFSLEASRDYSSYEQKYLARKPEFLLPNPWQTIQAMKAGYHVLAMAGEPGDFKGIFIVRKDGGIRTPLDLKGKAVSYPASTALAACIMPQYFLYKSGIDINKDIENRYVGSQESSIMNAYLEQTAAAATWPPPWRTFQKDHPIESKSLKVIWETEPLINNSVMFRNDIPVAIQDQVRNLLIGLRSTENGRSILAGMETTCFLPASDKDYEVVRVYVERFERDVRKVISK
jgi:phosphonate transport system substrate-binding protein